MSNFFIFHLNEWVETPFFLMESPGPSLVLLPILNYFHDIFNVWVTSSKFAIIYVLFWSCLLGTNIDIMINRLEFWMLFDAKRIVAPTTLQLKANTYVWPMKV
jgi:hypothetical protein